MSRTASYGPVRNYFLLFKKIVWVKIVKILFKMMFTFWTYSLPKLPLNELLFICEAPKLHSPSQVGVLDTMQLCTNTFVSKVRLPNETFLRFKSRGGGE